MRNWLVEKKGAVGLLLYLDFLLLKHRKNLEGRTLGRLQGHIFLLQGSVARGAVEFVENIRGREVDIFIATRVWQHLEKLLRMMDGDGLIMMKIFIRTISCTALRDHYLIMRWMHSELGWSCLKKTSQKICLVGKMPLLLGDLSLFE